MSLRLARLSLTCLIALLVGREVQAQRSRKGEPAQRKPFAAFNESAQRLRDSLAARVHGPESTLLGPTASFIMPETQELILRDSLIAIARTQLGTRYRLGAEQPGKAFDCSGLVRFVMGMLRLDLPRTADEQAQVGTEVPREVASLKPGDLLTFGTARRITHIGIYAGEGRVIHASVTKRRVIETDMARLGPKLLRTWRSARRLIVMADSVPTSSSASLLSQP